MFTIQVTGKYSGLVHDIGLYATREEALKALALREKHVGNATLTRAIVKV